MIALIGRHLCFSAAANVAAMIRFAWSRLKPRMQCSIGLRDCE